MSKYMVRVPGAIRSARPDDFIEMSPDEARRMAQGLLAAADIVEQVKVRDLGPLALVKWEDAE